MPLRKNFLRVGMGPGGRAGSISDGGQTEGCRECDHG